MKNKNYIRKNPIRPLAVAVAVAAYTSGTVAWAEIDSGGFVLEEIIVTAQKRQQSIQDVPAAVSVINDAALKDYNMKSFADLEQVTPGMVVESKSARAGAIALRGVDYDPNSAAAQAVDAYWNDTPVSGSGGGVFQQIFDLERVEVLKGPQGILQGRSSPAGAIIMHTAKPSLEEIEGFVSVQVGENNGINTTAAVSLPLIPGKLSTRFTVLHDDSDLDQAVNIATGSDSDKETTAGRFSLSWLPNDNVNIDFVYQRLESETTDFNILMGTPKNPADPVLGTYDRKALQYHDFEGDATHQRASLQLAWDLDDHQLIWLSGWSDGESNVPGENLSYAGNQNPALSKRQTTADQGEFLSQELRWSNTDGEMWEYMLGAYYSEENGGVDQHSFAVGDNPADSGTVGRNVVNGETAAVTRYSRDSQAVFGHSIVHLSEAWTAQLGLRWQNTQSKFETDAYAGPGGQCVFVVFPGGVPTCAAFRSEGEYIKSLIPVENQKRDDNAVTGGVTLQYDFVDPNIMVYGSYSTGYRAGGVTVSNLDLGSLIAFDEEDSWSAEFGIKSTLLNGRASVNGAVYYQEIDNFITRVGRINVQGQTNTGITDNANAEIAGVEVGFNILLTQDWKLGGGVNYVEAEYASGETLVCNTYDAITGSPTYNSGSTSTCDVGGQKLGPHPDLAITLNSEYTLPFDTYESYLRGLYRYNGEREDVDWAEGNLDAYHIFDLYMGVRSEARGWDVNLFVNNLFDEEEIVRVAAPGVFPRIGASGYQEIDVVPQRLIGINATYQF